LVFFVQFSDDRLHIRRTWEDKEPLLKRLARVEGQVRGLNQMIENDRYVGDEIQQASAIVAAVREVALMLIAQQLEKVAGSQRKDAREEMRAVLRLALPRCPDAQIADPRDLAQ
jgi:DNA-binding FrmR family transcriptional regulator